MDNNGKYLSPKEITEKYSITSNTLRNWAAKGKIEFIQPFGNKRYYSAESVRKVFGQKENAKTRGRILYARVSSDHQKADLERQVEQLKLQYPNTEVIKDIGSGLNWKRKGLEALLERIHEGTVSEVVVSYKDRLCRFGFELFDWICKKQNTKIVVLNALSDHESSNREKELSEDLLSIVTVFVAKNNGNRAATNRKIRSQNTKDTITSKSRADTKA